MRGLDASKVGGVDAGQPSAIWKFQLQVAATQQIEMPAGARVLTVREQDDIGCIWAEVDPSAPLETRTFHTLVTGSNGRFTAGLVYCGTYILGAAFYEGSFVGHIYEQPASATAPEALPESQSSMLGDDGNG